MTPLRQRVEALAGFARTPQVGEDASRVPVGFGMAGLMPQHAVERCERQLAVVALREHAAQARTNPKVLRIDLDDGVVALAGGRQVPGTI